VDCPVDGGLAQLARAPALHAGGQRFESVILHTNNLSLNDRSFNTIRCIDKFFDILGRHITLPHRLRWDGSRKGRMGNALALTGDEGRDKLR
jgi:hypothetical protein